MLRAKRSIRVTMSMSQQGKMRGFGKEFAQEANSLSRR
jgi:hypothetical protein